MTSGRMAAMAIAGLIVVNLVLVALALRALSVLWTRAPGRSEPASLPIASGDDPLDRDAAATPSDSETDALVEGEVPAPPAELDSGDLDALFAFDSRHPTRGAPSTTQRE